MTNSFDATLEILSGWLTRRGVSFLLYLFYVLISFVLSGVLRGWDVAITGDGAGHYVSGMMFEDYLFHNSTLNFFDHIADFHFHHPAVSVGLWPPLFHLIVAVWTGFFSASAISMLTLDAFIVGAAGSLAYMAAQRVLPFSLAVLSGVLTCVVPEYLSTSIVLKIDVFTGALVFASASLFSDFWQKPSWTSVFGTSFVTVCALLAKGTGMALVLILSAIAFWSFKLSRLSDSKVWFFVLSVGAVAGPWYILTSSYSSQGFRFEPGLDYTLLAIKTYTGYFLENLGLPGMLLMFVGGWIGVKHPEQKVRVTTKMLLGVVLGAILFQVLMPVALQSRYIAAIYIAASVLMLQGLYIISLKLAFPQIRAGMLAIGFIFLNSYLTADVLPRAPKNAAELAVSHRNENETPILMLTSFEFGGVLSIEILKTLSVDERKSVALIRGYKLLGEGGYNISDYKPKYSTSAQVRKVLLDSGIQFMLFEQTGARDMIAHNLQVQQLIKAYPEDFEILGRVQTEFESELILYKFSANDDAMVNWKLLRDVNSNRAYTVFQEKFGKP